MNFLFDLAKKRGLALSPGHCNQLENVQFHLNFNS